MAYLDRAGPPPKAATQGDFAQLLGALNAEITRGVDATAQRLGISVLNVASDAPEELPALFTSLIKAKVQALYVLESPRLMIYRATVADLALRHRLPTICGNPDFAAAGGLMSVNADFNDGWAKAATYVDRILRGAKPGDLAVEQPTRFQLIVNLKTANALGVTVPQSVLILADEVIQ
jgi:putative ABC transport system substrate-binding protein